jgi:hypothetical protein
MEFMDALDDDTTSQGAKGGAKLRRGLSSRHSRAGAPAVHRRRVRAGAQFVADDAVGRALPTAGWLADASTSHRVQRDRWLGGQTMVVARPPTLARRASTAAARSCLVRLGSVAAVVRALSARRTL